MTQITPETLLRRETATYHKGRPLVVILHPGFVEVREKGRRHGYAIDWLAVYHAGAKAKALADREEREAKRKAKRRNK